MKILVFGSCNIDLVYSVKNIVRPGETLAVGELNQFPGGKGFNQAIAAARAGAQTVFAGCIGSDGEFLRRMLNEAGADTRSLLTVEGKTGQATIQVDEKGENAILIYPGANARITREHIRSALAGMERGDYLLLQNEINELPYIVECAAEAGLRTVLNPSPFDESLRGIDLSKLECIILNETEACAFARSGDPFDFIAQAGGLTDIVLTLGEGGSVYSHGGRTERCCAYKTSVIDTTAAGDTFTGYLFASLCSGAAIGEACRTAAGAAAIAVSRQGAAASIPRKGEVAEWLKSAEPITAR